MNYIEFWRGNVSYRETFFTSNVNRLVERMEETSTEKIFAECSYSYEENEKEIELYVEDVKVEFYTEDDLEYFEANRINRKTIATYNKQTKKVTINADTSNLRFVSDDIKIWFQKVLTHRNKFLSNYLLKHTSRNYEFYFSVMFNNILKMINIDFDVTIKDFIKEVGNDEFFRLINSREIFNGDELNTKILGSLTKEQMEFINNNDLKDIFKSLRYLNNEDPNYVNFLFNYFDLVKKIKTGGFSRNSFSNLIYRLVEVKKELHDIDIPYLVEYLAKQRYTYRYPVKEKFGFPDYEAERYCHYVSKYRKIAELKNHYPKNVMVAANIVTSYISLQKNVGDIYQSFNEKVLEFKKFETEEDGTKLVAPKNTADVLEASIEIEFDLMPFIIKCIYENGNLMLKVKDEKIIGVIYFDEKEKEVIDKQKNHLN